MSASSEAQDPVVYLRNEFRRHLDLFYARLKLAPPYHSVEKAITQLTTTLKAMPPDERNRIVQDVPHQWDQFRRAFADSGLHQKHRGIIARLAKSRHSLDLPPEYDHFLSLFTSG